MLGGWSKWVKLNHPAWQELLNKLLQGLCLCILCLLCYMVLCCQMPQEEPRKCSAWHSIGTSICVCWRKEGRKVGKKEGKIRCSRSLQLGRETLQTNWRRIMCWTREYCLLMQCSRNAEKEETTVALTDHRNLAIDGIWIDLGDRRDSGRWRQGRASSLEVREPH